LIHEDNNVYGGAVNIASRICGLSAPGEMLVSSLLRQLVESSVSAETFVDARDVELKGLGGTHTVRAVRWTPASRHHDQIVGVETPGSASLDRDIYRTRP
jgi:class 3 adenylate cyclase